jgi:hypothetical protein
MLLDKVENGELSVNEMKDIAQKVLEIIPENSKDEDLENIVKQIDDIPILKGLGFGL